MTVVKLKPNEDWTAKRARGFQDIEMDINNLRLWTRHLVEQMCDHGVARPGETKHEAIERDGFMLLLVDRVNDMARDLHKKYHAALD
jgi:hypothetical protein